jgi:histidinol-phosphate aminotransferase
VSEARLERERLRNALSNLPGVRRVYDGHGNFLLVRFEAAEAVFRRLLAAGIVVLDLRAWPRLDEALRITIGTPEQNDGVIAALSTLEAVA